MSATARACRAVIAARLLSPGSEWAAFRAIQLANFTTPMVLDDDGDLERALAGAGGLPAVPGIDAHRVVAMLDSPEVIEAYEQDKAQARTAAGTPTEFQGKSANSDGAVRYTAPSLRFESEAGVLEAGGFQPVEAYDVLVANLDPTLERREAPETPEPLFEHFPGGLTTQEVAALLAQGNTPPDRRAAEVALVGLLADGHLRRISLGDDALWLAATA
jgi:hypothetical protein